MPTAKGMRVKKTPETACRPCRLGTHAPLLVGDKVFFHGEPLHAWIVAHLGKNLIVVKREGERPRFIGRSQLDMIDCYLSE